MASPLPSTHRERMGTSAQFEGLEASRTIIFFIIRGSRWMYTGTSTCRKGNQPESWCSRLGPTAMWYRFASSKATRPSLRAGGSYPLAQSVPECLRATPNLRSFSRSLTFISDQTVAASDVADRSDRGEIEGPRPYELRPRIPPRMLHLVCNAGHNFQIPWCPEVALDKGDCVETRGHFYYYRPMPWKTSPSYSPKLPK